MGVAGQRSIWRRHSDALVVSVRDLAVNIRAAGWSFRIFRSTFHAGSVDSVCWVRMDRERPRCCEPWPGVSPKSGDIRIAGLTPRDALARTGVALLRATRRCRSVRASRWKYVGNGDVVTPDRRPIRALSRGTRQLLGLRTVLGRQPLGLIVLDEPWEALDPDAARWLSTTLETKRDRGARSFCRHIGCTTWPGSAIRILFLLPHQARLVHARDISPASPVSAAQLVEVFDALRGGAMSLRAVS